MNTQKILRLVLGLALLLFLLPSAFAQKIVLQGFWWDYRHNNYPNGWANYLSDLAPRLKAMGIDAVWIPPTIKNGNQGNGYSPFDHYDLGDKYQKNFLKTRLGSKDELLRMVAILHANGIDVVQDIVLNHVDNAGSATGAGGQDPAAWEDNTTSKYKNFRYVSYQKSATDESAADYLSRSGRFPKNWQNFYPNPANSSTTGDWNAVYWGPDIAYDAGSYGQSSNASFNPTQGTNHMRNGTRDWLIWYKKQLGFDGVRIDAVKHFPHWAMEDFLANMQSNAGWANGGNSMFAVGEFVGGKSDLDGWCNNVQNRAGTFDFALRNGLNGIITGGGNFDLGSLPSMQQANRVMNYSGNFVHRTVPFVNNHDTYRPNLDANGNVIGWNTGSELAPHIDTFDPRLSCAYAVALAVDGSPQIFFEDLFSVAGTGKRFTHNPKSAADLPVKADIANLIWCHQNLKFKQGAYKVRFQAQDHLIIERSTKAIISINDNWSVWQNAWVQTDFAPGTVLKDYSGANGIDTKTVNASGQVNINTPPCNGTANDGRRGYAVWAPVNFTAYNLTPRSTTQEWEMADDLGDNHASSLKQGGQLPASSTALRTVGCIFVEANKPVSYSIFTSNATVNLTLKIYNTGGTQVHTLTNKGATISGTYTPTTTGWLKIKVQNAATTNPAQKVWVRTTYTPPADIIANNFAPPAAGREEGEEEEALNNDGNNDAMNAKVETVENNQDFSIYPNPTVTENIHIQYNSHAEQTVSIKVFDMAGKQVYYQRSPLYIGSNHIKLNPTEKLESGLYILSIPELNINGKLNIR
ncbi:MAG: DUF1939 domain-containing protein [Bacteroidetes bacterium]|nr:MAG: DUF1939 domain-containing protein [Bacteroidota bacterium]